MLLASVWFGLKEGIDSYRGVENGFQRVAAVCQILYGTAGLFALIALLLRARWGRAPITLWFVFVIATGILAPVVWGEQHWTSGLLAGGLTFAIAWLTARGYL